MYTFVCKINGFLADYFITLAWQVCARSVVVSLCVCVCVCVFACSRSYTYSCRIYFVFQPRISSVVSLSTRDLIMLWMDYANIILF